MPRMTRIQRIISETKLITVTAMHVESEQPSEDPEPLLEPPDLPEFPDFFPEPFLDFFLSFFFFFFFFSFSFFVPEFPEEEVSVDSGLAGTRTYTLPARLAFRAFTSSAIPNIFSMRRLSSF